MRRIASLNCAWFIACESSVVGNILDTSSMVTMTSSSVCTCTVGRDSGPARHTTPRDRADANAGVQSQQQPTETMSAVSSKKPNRHQSATSHCTLHHAAPHDTTRVAACSYELDNPPTHHRMRDDGVQLARRDLVVLVHVNDFEQL